ncbi:hypothetical protein K458DRAFT_395887 [Lentithecium fluviatile CBS 122367]|uniref:Aminoglycoside phosphotransferase domain-containing protein n=1 Tax=Lentithecium fluviatile CBS 122367 TaxID=1168545 RepID=A0A6G1IHV4_9PLEO|nr:hypothetical protein K458DRAFT_395887 [Lentithecium fluviatile CBS 122367]
MARVKKESFVLRHTDLDMQNLLVSDDGTVTGIIDWNRVMAMPRCVGATAIPVFLRRDWLPESMLMDAMAEYTDARYMLKSPIYEAALAALEGDGDEEDSVNKVFMKIPELQLLDQAELCKRIGAGWPAGEKFLAKKIAEVLKPE